MRKMALFLLSLILLSSAVTPQTQKGVSAEEEQKLAAYLKSHWKSPEDYVVEKFSKYDIVFIGESHRIKHDVELIHNLIPRLYKAGVYNLGIEFGRYEDQEKVDRLITADKYDEDVACWLQFKQFVGWGYKEYEDIYRKAWELNKSLPKGAPKFRVVALGYKVDWTQLQENMTDAQWKKVWFNGEPDEQMAEVILKEFVEKGKKALIYSGTHHAFTRYRQPNYDYQNKKFIGFRELRMGNIIYAKIPIKVFNIFLHSPWISRENPQAGDYPIGGVIDRVMRAFKNKRVGFDVVGTPFGVLREDRSYYSAGYPDFTLSTFCDGYIFQKQFKDYEGVTVDETFITEGNLQEAIKNLPNFEERKYIRKPEDMINNIRRDADFKLKFRTLE
jgi:hypothetical protein